MINPSVLPIFFSAGMLFLGIFGAFAVWVGRVIKGERASQDVADLTRKHELLKLDFHNYRVEAAEKFASTQTVREVEDKMSQAINRLGDRMDQAIVKAFHNKG